MDNEKYIVSILYLQCCEAYLMIVGDVMALRRRAHSVL